MIRVVVSYARNLTRSNVDAILSDRPIVTIVIASLSNRGNREHRRDLALLTGYLCFVLAPTWNWSSDSNEYLSTAATILVPVLACNASTTAIGEVSHSHNDDDYRKLFSFPRLLKVVAKSKFFS